MSEGGKGHAYAFEVSSRSRTEDSSGFKDSLQIIEVFLIVGKDVGQSGKQGGPDVRVVGGQGVGERDLFALQLWEPRRRFLRGTKAVIAGFLKALSNQVVDGFVAKVVTGIVLPQEGRAGQTRVRKLVCSMDTQEFFDQIDRPVDFPTEGRNRDGPRVMACNGKTKPFPRFAQFQFIHFESAGLFNETFWNLNRTFSSGG